MEKEQKFLTFEILHQLPDEILNVASDPKNSYLALLEESTYKQYYYPGLRTDLLNIIKEFNDIKYSYSANSSSIRCISTYEIRENMFLSNANDKIGNFIAQKVDSEILAVNTYNRILSLACKLTFEEATSEKIGFSRTFLQKVKKSCLVKMYFEFSDLLNNSKQS